ncbi:ABC transporter permease subunit [Peribacillus glennii]|uniref:ABC transporter permease n=1 Tax=Peribacillus glennii TaxID=2303991 RepID=A0A372LDF4_9BACI|nr:ABC transporter permease subunit [Peribacillus glennii]RFU64110.1 ABC transporter permease [Peribacillus glennii]
MNKHIIKAIAVKDIKSIFSSKKVWIPMVILSFILCIACPGVITYVGIHTDLLNQPSEDIEKPIQAVIEQFPAEEMRNTLSELPTLGSKFVYYFMHFMLIPLFLMTATIHSMVTASNSFAGEKERKTLETLLFSPISVYDLFLGKVLASLIPTLFMTYCSFIINMAVVNLMANKAFDSLLFLDAGWMVFMFWVIPAVVLFNILLNILVSARVKSFQEAQQFGGIMILPVVGIIISQASGLFFLSPFILFLIGTGLFIGNALLLRFITRFNQRNALFESQIH